jgi:hypothetical protein
MAGQDERFFLRSMTRMKRRNTTSVRTTYGTAGVGTSQPKL